MLGRVVLATLISASLLSGPLPADDAPNAIQFMLRSRVETKPGSKRHHIVTATESWDPAHTALIVCDVWDLHHSLNAVRREEEFAPRLNEVVIEARRRGVTIIHAPSSCMDSYIDHPARRRAIKTPLSQNLPTDIQDWCSRIPAEEQGTYPLDQSDGGADDDPVDAKAWAARLESMGRNPGTPWLKQSDLVAIEPQDYISDKGDEVWSILESKGITHIILAGVHTNMCVLGRPFGLRQMAKNGKRVVLLRDMTDTMYNPAMWPYVSHFTGTDRIIEHVEKYVCPTITSDQLIGGEPFVFKGDTRPHLVIVSAEDEYKTEETLPKFAAEQLGKVFRVTLLFGSEAERNNIPGTEVIDDADILLVSARRRPLPPEQLARFRQHVEAGKPMVGIRTASHPFHVKDNPPAGLEQWPEFDPQVWGGHYTGHHGNDKLCHVRIAPEQSSHPILAGVAPTEFDAGGSLYKVSPIADSAEVLMTGTIDGAPTEPVAWTYTRSDGGRSFYTSLGQPADFENPAFARMLVNGLCWAAGVEPPEPVTTAELEQRAEDWQFLDVAPKTQTDRFARRNTPLDSRWYRCTVRVPYSLRGPKTVVSVSVPSLCRAWWNGVPLASGDPVPSSTREARAQLHDIAEVNLLVVHAADPTAMEVYDPPLGLGGLSVMIMREANQAGGLQSISLSGRWQTRRGDDPSFATLPLPAIYGASPDILFEP